MASLAETQENASLESYVSKYLGSTGVEKRVIDTLKLLEAIVVPFEETVKFESDKIKGVYSVETKSDGHWTSERDLRVLLTNEDTSQPDIEIEYSTENRSNIPTKTIGIVRTNIGNDPEEVAAYKGIVAILKENGSDIELKDNKGDFTLRSFKYSRFGRNTEREIAEHIKASYTTHMEAKKIFEGYTKQKLEEQLKERENEAKQFASQFLNKQD